MDKKWIISFSKEKGEISIKDQKKNRQKEIIDNAKKTELYKTIMDYFPDAELIHVKSSKNDDE